MLDEVELPYCSHSCIEGLFGGTSLCPQSLHYAVIKSE